MGNKYKVKLNSNAYEDIEKIYSYLAYTLFAPEAAERQTNRIHSALRSLAIFPYAHQERLEGRYAEQGYRQLLIDNYIAIYRVDEEAKTVHIITVQYEKRDI